MLNYELLLMYLFAVLLFLLTPGPVVALVLKNSLMKGFKAGFLTALGTNLASLCLIAVAVLVILGFFQLSQNFLFYLTLLGSVFIFWLGLHSFLANFKEENAEAQKNNFSFGNEFIQGFFIAISSPKDILFFIAFFPQFFSISPSLNVSLFMLVALWIVCDFCVLLMYAFLCRKSFLPSYKKHIAFVSDFALMCIGIFGFFSTIFLIKT